MKEKYSERWEGMSPKAKAHALEYGRKYYLEHRERRLDAAKKWAREHREIVRSRMRVERRKKDGIYHVTGDEERFGICCLCSKESALVADHDHASGLMRDWICSSCNLRLGQFEAREASGQHRRFREYLLKFK